MMTQGWNRTRWVLSVLLAYGCLVGLNSSACAQGRQLNWAERMFSELSCDLGTVAHRSQLRHRIEIQNIYQETVRIENVKKNCGCTEFTLSRDVLQTFESAFIDLNFNTTDFLDEKQSSIDVTVSFAGGSSRTVHIPIRYFVRRDIVFTPGAAEFSEVVHGIGGQRLVRLEFTGHTRWQVTSMSSTSQYVSATATETSRRNGKVSYDLQVLVDPSTPLGQFREQLVLTTNDHNNPRLTVMVTGEVVPDIVVNTELQDMGEMTPGSTRNFTIIIRGRQPFVVENVESATENGGYFQVRLPQDAKAVHIIPMSFEAPTAPGVLEEEFLVTIEGRDEPVRFKACCTIVDRAN